MPMRRWMKVTVTTLGAVALLVIVVGLAVDHFRWRLEVLALIVAGRVPDLTLREAIPMLRPNGRYYLRPLLTRPSPYATIENPYRSDADSASGAELFRGRCALCHGAEAPAAVTHFTGGHFRHGGSDWALYRNITRGIAGTAMRPQTVSEREAWQLVTFIRKLGPAPDRTAGPAQADSLATILARLGTVDAARLVGARQHPADWLMYSGAYDGWRYSGLKGLSRANVGRLRIQWILQLPSGTEKVESSPVVVDGVMYLTGPPNSVYAVDAATGTILWTYQHDLPDGLQLCCGQVNRGVAVSGTRVYVTTLDAHLLALDARTGELIWDTTLADYQAGYSGTGAPLIVADKVIVGIAGGEFGVRGFIDAYDAGSGRQLWRFNTVPGPGEPGHETWGGESWKTGGAPTWLTGSYDPALGLIYWGVGNPAPDFNGDNRPGANLFSNCVVALDAATGRLRWHFQFTPHDEHDWDSVQIPVLLDASWQGRPRHLMLWANRNGFYYLLDRETGQFLLARPFVRQTWAARIDSTGTPVLSADAAPSIAGTTLYPSGLGGTNWFSPSYSPEADLLFVPVVEQGSVYNKTNGKFRPGESFLGSASQPVPEEEPWTAVRAIRPATGEVIWDHRFIAATTDSARRPINGIMTTAGGLLFGSDASSLVALETGSGKELWRFNAGAPIRSAPMAYSAGGSQLIAVAAGNSILAFSLR